ncbi:MAG: hypothetical protein QNJ54_03855 [Prochloraceae cyanobacterium]|nr:hypothetical protein [Prochloraceae cyanobacterium]
MESSPNSLPKDNSVVVSKKSRLLRTLKYMLIGTLCNSAIWGLSIFYLKTTAPSYTSEMILNVGATGPGVNINLPNIGQAITSSSSAFGRSSDPRENYKLIAMSPAVLAAAAASLDISEQEFGEPTITIVNNTTMLMVELDGSNPANSQAKVKALYEALYKRIESLREAELLQRNQAIQKAVENAQVKLTQAQKNISLYKAKSGLNSSNQITDLINNIESLRKQRAEIIAQQQQVALQLQQLSAHLKLSPQEAADALALQTDRQFQKYLTEYADATTTLISLQKNRGPNYPDVVVARQKQEAALTALLERGQILLNRPVEQLTLERLSLDNSNGSGIKRSELFQKVVTLNARSQGIAAQVIVLTQQIAQLEARLADLTPKESILESLERDLQIAEAVFASTLAKIDLGKGDPFGSFPLLQIIEEPSLPDNPTSPKTKLVLAGSLLGSILVSTGLILIWWREPVNKAMKNIVREILA